MEEDLLDLLKIKYQGRPGPPLSERNMYCINEKVIYTIDGIRSM
jgi:hypothetical protein